MALEGTNNQNGFWTNSPQRDPKRAYRFRVQFGNSGPLWYAKKAVKPTITITESTHQYLNHTYYWPAKTEWNEVDITFVDPVEPDLAGDLVSSIRDAGYFIPAGANDTNRDFSTPSKAKMVAATTGDADAKIIIEQIDEDGNTLEKWTLWHAWIKELTFGDLDYGSEDLTEVMVKFRYDWAQFDGVEGGDRNNIFTPGQQLRGDQ